MNPQIHKSTFPLIGLNPRIHKSTFPLIGLNPRIHKSTFPLIDLREHARHEQHTNLNSQITGYLEKAIEHIKAESTKSTDEKAKKNVVFRIRSLQKAIDVLTNYPAQVTSGREAQELPGIGKGISRRIDEILLTGRLAEVETIQDKYVVLIKELTNISGIGLVKAKRLINDYQITGIDDLIERYQKGEIKLGKNQLTHHQIVGLRWSRDLDQKIPRIEIDEFVPVLDATVKAIDPDLIAQVCGSYRRGKLISGDIDVLVTNPQFKTKEAIEKRGFLPQIVKSLTEKGIIIDHLTEDGHTKYMGVCRIREVARRIDIRVLPWTSYPTALLYFTGSGNFNVMFRAIALQRGFTISEYAVCPLKDGVKGDPIPVESEQDIFDIVGIQYLTPAEREL